jgi:hypothetical protein
MFRSLELRSRAIAALMLEVATADHVGVRGNCLRILLGIMPLTGYLFLAFVAPRKLDAVLRDRTAAATPVVGT